MKKLFLFAISFLMLFATSFTGVANADVTKENCNCSVKQDLTPEQIKEKLSKEGINVIDNPAQADIDTTVSILNSYDLYKNTFTQLVEDGYSKVPNSEDFIAFENSNTGETVLTVGGLLQKGSNVVIYTGMGELKSGNMIKFNFYKNGQLIASSDELLSPLFTVDWGSFACSMAGLYTCIHYCGIWAVVNPIAGGTCEIVCGTAFALGCAM